MISLFKTCIQVGLEIVTIHTFRGQVSSKHCHGDLWSGKLPKQNAFIDWDIYQITPKATFLNKMPKTSWNSRKQTIDCFQEVNNFFFPYNGVIECDEGSSGSRGRGGHAPPPGLVKISHKKDGCRRWPHRFHVSRPPPYLAAGSATVKVVLHPLPVPEPN